MPLRAISLNPNIHQATIKQVRSALFHALLGQQIPAIDDFVSLFKKKYNPGAIGITTYLTGRAAWFTLLKALGIGDGDEVMLPGCTCVAVVNPVRWCGASPVFIDNDEDFHIDWDDAEKKITAKTKLLLVQHTFGQPDDLTQCAAFCKDHEIALVEDCAHALGATVNNRLVGTFGKAAFYSFGRDKCLTAGTGGLLVVRDDELAQHIQTIHKSLPQPSLGVVVRHLSYILTTEWIYQLYALHPLLGKAAHSFFKMIGINQTANSVKEKRGEYDETVLLQWDDHLASIGLVQLGEYDAFISHRREIASLYDSALTSLENNGYLRKPSYDVDGAWLRYSVVVADPDKLRAYCAQKQLFLGDWYDQVIGPHQVDLSSISYASGSAPTAEWLSAHVINLPTSPRFTKKDAEVVVTTLQEYFSIYQEEKLERRNLNLE